jgi:hypothetical protein
MPYVSLLSWSSFQSMGRVAFYVPPLPPVLIYLVSNGVHMGSNQVLPAFFANLSSFLAPVFFMIVSPLSI